MKKHPQPPRKKRALQSPPQAAPATSPGTAAEFSARLEVITTLGSETSEPPLNVTPVNLRPVRFGYFKPDAREVFLAGSFNNWDPRATPLQRDALGDWTVELQLPPGEYHYRLVMDGDWRTDPAASRTVANPFGGFDAVVEI